MKMRTMSLADHPCLLNYGHPSCDTLVPLPPPQAMRHLAAACVEAFCTTLQATEPGRGQYSETHGVLLAQTCVVMRLCEGMSPSYLNLPPGVERFSQDRNAAWLDPGVVFHLRTESMLPPLPEIVSRQPPSLQPGSFEMHAVQFQ